MKTARFRDYGDRYVVFEDGTVLGKAHDELLKPSVQNGVLYYILYKNSVGKTYVASRLIYEAFNGEFKGMIDFKDGDKKNISLDNLINVPMTKKFIKQSCQRIRCRKTKKEWDSVSQLSREIGVSLNCVLVGLRRKNSKYNKLYEKIQNQSERNP